MNMLNNWVEAAGWTLIHSLWQSAGLALLAFLLVKLSGGRSSRLNYAVFSGALAAAMLVSFATFAARLDRTRTPVGDVTAPAGPVEPVRAEGAAAGLGSERLTQALPGALPVIVALWAGGVFAMSLRLMLGLAWLRRARASARLWDDATWQSRFQDLARQAGVRRTVALCTTALAETASVLGHFKPVILLPAALVARVSPGELEAILLHELMHIRRNDFLVNLIQVCCETLYFFNPAIWWLSHAVRAEREHCCDERVAEAVGSRLDYAKALARIEELRLEDSGVLALAASGSSLRRRIARLLRVREDQSSSGWAGVAGVVLLTAAFCVLARPNAVAAEAPNQVLELRSVVEQGAPDSETLTFEQLDLAGKPSARRISVSQRVLLDNRHVSAAHVTPDPLDHAPRVEVTFSPEGARLFAEITRAHVGRQIAVVIDGKIVMAPVVNEAITGGKCVINGNFTAEEAAALARKLRPAGTQAEEIEAPAWEPPSGTRPSDVLKEAGELMRAGKYPEALARHVWYHTASRLEPGQAGVRLSFALGDWLRLGQAYPPALAKFKEVRDETEHALRAGGQAVDPFLLFQEYNGLNRTLGEQEKTAALFRWLDQNNPEVAARVYRLAQPVLLRDREYQTIRKYLGPESFEDLAAPLRHLRERKTEGRSLEVLERRFQEDAAVLVGILVLSGERPEAEKIVSQALKEHSTPEFKELLDAALRGELPVQRF